MNIVKLKKNVATMQKSGASLDDIMDYVMQNVEEEDLASGNLMEQLKIDVQDFSKRLEEVEEFENISDGSEEDDTDDEEKAVRDTDTTVTDDSLKSYLLTIGEYPVMTPEDEKETFEKYIKAEGNYKKILRDKIFNSNLKLVVSIAKYHFKKKNSLTMLDLIQEGNLGLMKSIDKFNVTLGFRFSTYATWWIKQSITRAIADQANVVRLPVHMTEQVMKYNKAKNELFAELGREPKRDELIEAMKISEKKFDEIEKASVDVVSMDLTVGEDGDTTLQDMIPDDKIEAPDKQVDNDDLHNMLLRLLETLPPREQKVIKLRYGLEGERWTLDQIGDMLGITRERVRQIENKALRKMKGSFRLRMLDDYKNGI